MAKQALFFLSLLLVFLFHCTTTLGQPAQAPTLPAVASPANAPAPPGPPDVVKILQKVGGFTILIRLLKSTGVADQLKGQLNDSSIRFTLFAPNDNSVSNLKAGTLNSLNNEEKVRLIQFHILPTYYTLENFQTVSNPVRTQAGDNKPGDYPLNVTSVGSQVNISTGLVNASVSGTLYSNFQLAIYQVDKVLLPLDLFVPKPPSPAPAPAPTKPKAKKTTAAASPKTSTTSTAVDSGAVSIAKHGVLVSIGVAIFIAFSL
ncbi:fasciclin-like arabinogalactan protein 12 [Quercus lobata]|uniref:FAS1 domain-containing protein n=1 Tax=Quercus lobata TaxID=97700 RepID=A0A7N2KND5_QUELO|nr:fasciclin-like arabinogalactan protein 12 [Quercus lobata]